MIGWAIRQLVIWSALALLLYAVADNLAILNPPAASGPSSGAVRSVPDRPASNSLVYHADKQGHVALEAAVNGSPVRFLVDTGATVVALTPDDAVSAGFRRSDFVFNVSTSTANGVGRAAAVKLREVRIGQFSVYDVPAYVIENLRVSLLGQSFLTRLDSYEMRDGVLTLNWN